MQDQNSNNQNRNEINDDEDYAEDEFDNEPSPVKTNTVNTRNATKVQSK